MISSICYEDFKNAHETFENGLLLTDRYNTQIYNQNISAREQYDFECIYGSPKKNNQLKHGVPMYIIEMNVETDLIEGIGYLYNNPLTNLFVIYQDHKYVEWNNNLYTGDYHITREDIHRLFPDILDKLENKLFKGKGNQKRGKGFTRLSAKIYSETFTEIELASAIKQSFIHKYF